MRPHELTVRGFRSYRDEVTFDFRGRHLIGIVGPIGAGWLYDRTASAPYAAASAAMVLAALLVGTTRSESSRSIRLSKMSW